MVTSGLGSDQTKRYKSNLVACMNFLYKPSEKYPKTHNFTDEELFTLTPEHIFKYMAHKAYGKIDPNFNTDFPTKSQSSTLKFAKKAISYYIPNRLLHWNEQTKQGNLSRSNLVNELIKTVKKKEVRRQGRVLSAQRPMESTEFIELIMQLRADTCPSHKYTLAAYFIFQYNLMVRLDDVKNFKLEDLTPSLEYKYVLKSKTCWSKNVLEERDAPDQILLGAMYKKFCVLVTLAVHLEHGLMNGTLGSNADGGAASSEVTLLFGVEKHHVLTQLQQILQALDFPNARPGLLGSHSIHKFTATYARRNRCSRDDVDTRG
jgi:hypothetical protein